MRQVVEVLVIGILCGGCARSCDPPPEPARPPQPAAGPLAKGRRCPSGVDKTPRPQNAAYRGDCLDKVVNVAGALNPESPPSGPVSAVVDNGTTDGKRVTLQVAPTGKTGTLGPGRPIPLLHVKLDGQNLCEDSKYPPTDWERKALCGDASTCEALTVLNQAAIAVPGHWKDSVYHSAVENPGNPTYSLSCISGVIAKCVLWGYAPWRPRPKDPSKTLEDYYTACVHAARANYLPEDREDYASFTCQDTEIDIYDNQDIQRKHVAHPVESVWTKSGLLRRSDRSYCLHHTRYRKCEGDLLGVSPSVSCADPGRVDGSWDASYPDTNALIAVAGPTDRELKNGECPRSTKDESVCPRR